MESTRVSNSKKFAMTVAKEKAVTASALILPECLEKLTCGWQMDKYLSREEDVINSTRVFVREIVVKIPSQKTHLGNLTYDFPDDCSSE